MAVYAHVYDSTRENQTILTRSGGFFHFRPSAMLGALSLLARLAQFIPRGLSMFDGMDLTELGLDEEKGAALKEVLAAKHQEALDHAVSGLKTKNSELLGTIKSTKTELDKMKGQFDGLDIEAVKGLLTKVGQDEETKLIAEGKLDEVIARRTERLRPMATWR